MLFVAHSTFQPAAMVWAVFAFMTVAPRKSPENKGNRMGTCGVRDACCRLPPCFP